MEAWRSMVAILTTAVRLGMAHMGLTDITAMGVTGAPLTTERMDQPLATMATPLMAITTQVVHTKMHGVEEPLIRPTALTEPSTPVAAATTPQLGRHTTMELRAHSTEDRPTMAQRTLANILRAARPRVGSIGEVQPVAGGTTTAGLHVQRVAVAGAV